MGGFPIVFTGPGENGPAVVTDNESGVFQAIEHLWKHGHRRIAYIAGYEDIIGDSSIRLEAFKSVIQTFALDPEACPIAYGMHTVEGGQLAMAELLDATPSFTAVLASNLRSAIGTVHSLRETGRRVPDDVAVIGIDDRVDAEAQVPPITTVNLQTYQMGYQAVGLLLEYIDGRRHEPTTLRVPAHLVVRRSCGCQLDQPQQYRRLRPDQETVPVDIAGIAQAMSEAAIQHSHRFDLTHLFGWRHRLAEAFYLHLKRSAPVDFIPVLAEFMDFIDSAGETAHLGHQVMTVLRQNIDGLIHEPDDTFRDCRAIAEDLVDRAHLMISSRNRQQTARYRVEREASSDRLGTMTTQLLATLSEAEILDILMTHLPSLGIRHAQIVTVEAEDDDPAAWSEWWRRVPDGEGIVRRRFRTTQFPPSDLGWDEEPFRLALLPLIAQVTQIGYMAFDAGRLEPCGAIARQVSAALMSCRLYREANEGRRRAEEADQLKTQFLSMVSHELRTPLNLIVGLSDLILREQAQGKNPSPQDLEYIRAGSQHLEFLIHDVLDLASSHAGRMRLSLEALDLAEVLQSILVLGEQSARAKGLAWRVDIPEHRLRVLGDRTRLRQVVMNLITNAIKFTSQGTVYVAAREEGTEILVSVSDTGVGVPPDELSSIFNEFHQSERTSARGHGGLGLGLAICKHLIELHGGSIGVRSSGVEGEGATFYFTMPVLTEVPSVDIPSLSYGRVVRLVAKGKATAERVRAHLRQQGFEVDVRIMDESDEWQSGPDTLVPDSILLDKQLIVEHGWQSVSRLRDNPTTRDVPIVLYALPEETTRGSVLELNYHTKPLDAEQLSHILAPLINQCQSPCTILIVDDDRLFLELHARLVHEQLPACRVLQAHHGLQALEILQTERPDLILLDLMMPELDGFGVLESLHASESTRDIPVIVLSSKALTESEMARLNRSVVTVLEKGVFNAEETLEHVTSALTRSGKPRSITQGLVRKAIAFIHEHATEPISRQHIADHVCVSENYLTNCFQQEIGISPITYLKRYRIKRARDLLEAGNRNVLEVAMAVGFSDCAYFSRVFKQEVGLSPSAYRRGARKH
jgi:signal transduction histidine kinase/CheY-like chemotaxis protein/AraC-like DNA-binding protein